MARSGYKAFASRVENAASHRAASANSHGDGPAVRNSHPGGAGEIDVDLA